MYDHKIQIGTEILVLNGKGEIVKEGILDLVQKFKNFDLIDYIVVSGEKIHFPKMYTNDKASTYAIAVKEQIRKHILHLIIIEKIKTLKANASPTDFNIENELLIDINNKLDVLIQLFREIDFDDNTKGIIDRNSRVEGIKGKLEFTEKDYKQIAKEQTFRVLESKTKKWLLDIVKNKV